jgi:hypothetical protein
VLEYWIEINLFARKRLQDEILLDVLKPHVEKLERRKSLVTWHFFREPEIRFRIRLKNEKVKDRELKAVKAIANSLKRRGLVSSWNFGNHGEREQPYVGEEDRYGRNGWKIAQKYFRCGAETALGLLALKRDSKLENPLWARGLGNPWEGGTKNPWRQRQKNPLVYHWSRYVHLFTNQLGFETNVEADLCSKQASRYRWLSKQIGMKW